MQNENKQQTRKQKRTIPERLHVSWVITLGSNLLSHKHAIDCPTPSCKQNEIKNVKQNKYKTNNCCEHKTKMCVSVFKKKKKKNLSKQEQIDNKHTHTHTPPQHLRVVGRSRIVGMVLGQGHERCCCCRRRCGRSCQCCKARGRRRQQRVSAGIEI